MPHRMRIPPVSNDFELADHLPHGEKPQHLRANDAHRDDLLSTGVPDPAEDAGGGGGADHFRRASDDCGGVTQGM